MINKRNIFGINVDDYSLKESMLKVDNFLNNTVLNTIHIINFDSLMDATENKVMKKCIEGLDLSIIGDEDILSFIGIESESRHNEISDNVFINEFLEKVEKSGATVYLVGSTNEVIESFANVLDKKYPDINCIGRQIYEKEFGERIGEEITNNIDIQLFERIKNNLNGIFLAKHYISDRLSSEFNIFVM